MEILKRWLIGFLLVCCLPVWAGGHAKSVWMEDLTWVELKARIDAGTKSVILPTGGVEQNGPYIALGKHNWVVRYAAQEIASSLGNTLIAPVVRVVPQGDISKPKGNLLFPGTLALQDDTFERVLHDTVLSLAYAGFQHIYLLGDHGLSQQIQAKVAMQTDALLTATHVRVWHVSSYYQPELEAKYLSNQGIDGEAQGEHAGVGDMAQIMALSPAYVRQTQKTTANAKGLGFSGKPELATPVLGRALLKLRINEAIKQIKGFQ
jgi:creatinine amidohydrolase/Fe(II)-dependent formamide hydrolase-like protein